MLKYIIILKYNAIKSFSIESDATNADKMVAI